MNAKPADFAAYVASAPEDARAMLIDVRRLIRAVAPEAVESISYGVPTYKYRGRPLAYFGAAKNHCALYGFSSEGHEAELAAYGQSGKGTIRFAKGEPLPDALITALVSERKARIEVEAEDKRRNSTRPVS